MPERLIAGRYRLLSVLGRGGMGTVWRARDEVLRRPVAVKEVSFPPGISESELALLSERTLREARLAAQVSAPGAVRGYDVVEDNGRPCIVMELVEGRTLSDVLRDDGPLSPQRTAQIGVSIAEALAAAHEAGVIHRDVKPSNVILQPGGRATLTDFGIARGNDDASLTSTGLLVGSPAYISPERVRGRPPQPASDVWSLGATLFTAVEGRAPFEGADPIATMTAVGRPAADGGRGCGQRGPSRRRGDRRAAGGYPRGRRGAGRVRADQGADHQPGPGGRRSPVRGAGVPGARVPQRGSPRRPPGPAVTWAGWRPRSRCSPSRSWRLRCCAAPEGRPHRGRCPRSASARRPCRLLPAPPPAPPRRPRPGPVARPAPRRAAAVRGAPPRP